MRAASDGRDEREAERQGVGDNLRDKGRERGEHRGGADGWGEQGWCAHLLLHEDGAFPSLLGAPASAANARGGRACSREASGRAKGEMMWRTRQKGGRRQMACGGRQSGEGGGGDGSEIRRAALVDATHHCDSNWRRLASTAATGPPRLL